MHLMQVLNMSYVYDVCFVNFLLFNGLSCILFANTIADEANSDGLN